MTNIAVIMGGGGGMGLATAKILSRDHHVILCDRAAGRLEQVLGELQSLGVAGEAIACDIADRAPVEASP